MEYLWKSKAFLSSSIKVCRHFAASCTTSCIAVVQPTVKCKHSVSESTNFYGALGDSVWYGVSCLSSLLLWDRWYGRNSVQSTTVALVIFLGETSGPVWTIWSNSKSRDRLVTGQYNSVRMASQRARSEVQSASKKVKFSHTRYRALGPELIPQVTWSESRHIPSSSLPLLSARPAFTFVAFTRWRYL